MSYFQNLSISNARSNIKNRLTSIAASNLTRERMLTIHSFSCSFALSTNEEEEDYAD
jgi:hypothetical protein